MKGITYCGACADYDIKRHRCKRGAMQESNPQDKFFKVCPRSPRMAAFIGYTQPGETKPALKTSPVWCPMRPENKEEET